MLEERCRAAVLTRYPTAGERERHTVETRLGEELKVIAELGYPTYFLTVAAVVDLIRDMGVRVAARLRAPGRWSTTCSASAGSTRSATTCSWSGSAPRCAPSCPTSTSTSSPPGTEVYERVLERFGGDRVTCVSMMDTYKVRHAVRDVGAALGLPPQEIDEIAKAFPHIRARDARSAIAELPELRGRGREPAPASAVRPRRAP